jgi:hypothetical protein
VVKRLFLSFPSLFILSPKLSHIHTSPTHVSSSSIWIYCVLFLPTFFFYPPRVRYPFTSFFHITWAKLFLCAQVKTWLLREKAYKGKMWKYLSFHFSWNEVVINLLHKRKFKFLSLPPPLPNYTAVERLANKNIFL